MEGSVFGTPQQQRLRDTSRLKLLGVFHFVFAGLALLGIGFLFLHHLLMTRMMAVMPSPPPVPNGPPFDPRALLDVFRWFYLAAGVLFLAGSMLNLLSGIFLLGRRHRTFSLVVAGLDCLQIPFGTLLGIFTLATLLSDSVRQAYEAEKIP